MIGYDWWLLMLLSVTVLLIWHNHLFELHYRPKVWGEYDFLCYFVQTNVKNVCILWFQHYLLEIETECNRNTKCKYPTLLAELTNVWLC